MAKKKYAWADKVINGAQIGGIETSVLDDGLGRGVRIAWVNTGSGLRYKVVIDRALDIADTFFNEHSIAFLTHSGVTAPRPDANRGLEWLWSFGGGLLATCGLRHVGGPEDDEYGQRGLHGRISNMPASIESIVQPDAVAGKLDMSITGVVKESRLFGPNLEMRRTISSKIGEPTVRISDVITNLGNSSVPHMVLYHCNFGWPLVDEGADIVWRGKWNAFEREMDREIFNKKVNFRKCPKPLAKHAGDREACAYIDVKPDGKGVCKVGVCNQELGLAVVMRYKKKQLPHLTNWQHWGAGDYVTALEPGTNPSMGQSGARKQKQLIFLRPGESRKYELELSVLAEEKEIAKFLKAAGE